ncbi:hypothetical protein [Fibrobacter succinogenes]|uniref:hypothetical protein n=1 Tax=Fibrobacter succinogenes TaxID=833 RepID=UPI001569FC96|nr:hypothetical protein [Fibrobacter succinogenes]
MNMMKIDGCALSVDCILSQAQKRIDELQQVIDFLQMQLEKAPEGTLYSTSSHSQAQWQRIVGSKRSYLSKGKTKLIRALAQKKYNTLLLDDFKRQRSVLDQLVNSYVPQNGEKIFMSMGDRLREQIVPLNIPDSDFADLWQSLRYKGKTIENTGLLTAKGECVRSKSEIIIADVLASLGIPYRYEFPHELKCVESSRCVKVYSDFTCLNVRTRKEFVWEHFGMMDDAEYAQNAVVKIEMYQNSGYFLGDNFIFTMESRDKPLNSQMVQKLAKKYLV